MQNSFTFHKRVRPDPQHQTFEPSFEARIQSYMVTHTERMERFEKTIFKQREEINDKKAKMFRLLKELTTSRTPKKVPPREEARHPITKNVNAISLVKIEKDKNIKNNKVVDNNVIELSELNAIEPKEKVDMKKKVGHGTNNEPVRSVEEEITGDGIEELVEMPRSRHI
nr:hypothetical protein [Tanacetum cinerariifolium]